MHVCYMILDLLIHMCLPLLLLWLNKDLILLDRSFYVATLVGEIMVLKYVYKSCQITMADKEMIVNLVILDLLEFDLILGMDWLATYHATIYFHLKMVKFNLLGEPTFMVQGD